MPIKAYYSSLNRKPPPIPQSELLSKLQIKSALEHKFRQPLFRPGIFGELANSLLPLAILGHRDKFITMFHVKHLFCSPAPFHH